MRRIGVSLVKEARLFDQALFRYDIGMTRIEARIEHIRHYIGAQERNKEDTETDREVRAVKKCLSQVNAPTNQYLRYQGVWQDIGEILRRRKRLSRPITPAELQGSFYGKTRGYVVNHLRDWIREDG